MGAVRAALLLLCALLALAAAAPTEEPSRGACPRGCRCFAAAGAEDETAANCSSPAAALALGARLRVLRLSRFDDHLSVKEGAFRALSGLRELHLDHLGLVKVYPGAFRGLNQLETLDLSHNALSAGDEVSRALRDLPALRRLSLRGNNFGAAHGVAPALASRTLKFVDLGRCKLRALPPTVFAGLTHVRHIVLDGNFIREIVAAAFPRSVVSLDLSHNDIDRVSVAELNKLENVDSIELAENPIHCTCELLKISFEYNMNKAVVCAYPKQLMGKDLLKIKKHQVCAGHKKVKREAGNELDDEALSAEELANGDDLGTNPQEDDPEDTVDAVNNPVEETDADDAEGDANAADTEEEEEETPEQPPDKLANEPKGPAVENARDEAEETEPEAPAASAEEKNEPDEEPEDVDGIAEERKSSKESEKIVLDDGINEEEGEVVDHAAPHAKSDTPPDEADDTEEEPEEAAEPPADGEEEEPADDENVESTHVGAAIRNDDMEDEDDADEIAQETSNVEPVEPFDKEDNAEEEESAAENDDDVAEEDPPESLPASAYNHIRTEDENASQYKETGGENEAEHNEEPVPDKAPIKTDNENYSAPEVADPPLEEPTDSEIEDYSAPEVADPPKDDNIDDDGDDAETRDAVIPDAPNSGNEDPVKETPGEAESAEEENTPEHTHTIPAAAVPDSTLDDDVEESDIGNSQGAAIAGEGARMETDPKTEDADNADGDVPDDDETETQNEDEDALNTVNNEDDTLSAVVPSRTNDNEGEDNSDEADNAETDEVENVPSNDNVVHSSGVGARVESEDREVDAADADEGTDGDANGDGNTSILAAGINVEDENKEETEALDPNPDNEDDTDAAGNTGVDTIENEAEENTEEENEDAKNSDVLVAAGLDNGSEEGEGDENVAESENLGTGLVDAAEETKNIEEEKTLEEELEDDRSHATLGHEDIDREISGAEHTNDAADNEPTEEKVEDGDEMPIIIPPQTSDKQNEDDNVDTNDELERENDILDENENKHTGQSQTEGTGDTDGDEPKEYEEVIEGDEQQRKSPGGALSVAPTDNEDSEEEGSGNVLDALEDTEGDTHKYEDDWADASETDNANENEAVPPLGNADSKEVAGDSGERVDEAARVDPSEEPPLVIAAGDDASEEEYTGSGAGAVVPGDVPLDRGDEEPASNEEDEGSGQAVPFGHGSAITGDVTEKPDDEDEDGSGKGVFIPVLPGRDRPEDTDVEVDEGMDGLDYNDKATTVAPVVAPEDEIVPRVHMPPQAAPPGVREEEPLPSEEDEEIPAEGGAVVPEGEPEDAQGRDRSDSGRALVPAERPASADDVDDTDAEFPDENANAGGDGDLNVDVAPGMDDAKKGNIAEADEDRADGSEALNKDAAMSMNTIASYVVLGAIMIIVVFLLGYAVCRSRRQKSPSALDKDPENPDRELQEVNKPLINNHHPAAPEKEPLDETQQPLMTKEQEASLTVDPEKKPLTEDTTDAANHKTKQNGSVPEVAVVEKQAVPMANGKAASPAAERAPSPAAPSPALSPTAAAAPPSPTTPTAPAAANGNALPLANGGGSVSPGAAPPPASSPAAPPVSPGAVRVVAKELPDSVAKRPVIIMNRGADPPQQV